jgi:pilus assembly protein CpaC
MNVAAPTQVNLQVRIAEVNRNVDRQLGIRWGAMGISTNGNAQWGLVGGGSANGARDGGYSATLGYTSPRLNVDVLLQALSEEGMVTVLAEPNLTARSGESANFLAGGEYPYQTVSDNGTNTEFKPFGIGLSFTPTVLDGNRISLTVETEVSDLNFSYNTEIPSLVSRRAETTVDLASGQSFAIAGLMQSTSAQNASKMPGINNIPVLGALFRSSGFKRGQTELVIIVTPIIVQPTTAQRVRTPVDGYVPPNDFERILLGRFQGNTSQTNQVRNRIGQRRLYGNSGFVFE